MLIRDVPTRKFLPTLERYEPTILDHTAFKEFKSCPRKYFYRIVLGRKLQTAQNQDIFNWGNAVHKLLECLYEGKSEKEAFMEAMKIYKVPAPGSKWEFLDMVRFLKTVEALNKFHAQEMRSRMVEVHGIEQPFNIEMPDGQQIGGRFDQIISVNGRPLVRDWKTTTKQTSWFIPGLNPNDQATRYVYAYARLMGWSSSDPAKKKPDGVAFVIIENLKNNKTGPKREPIIQTVMINKSLQELIIWEKEQMFLHTQLNNCRQQDIWPMNEGNCQWCDYRDVCTTSTDGAKEFKLKNNFILSPWDHQKVSQEVMDG